MLARIVFIFTGLLVATPSFAATFNVGPIEDAFVTSANPANNYGGAGALGAAAIGLPKGEFQSLLKFDLSAAQSSFDATFGSRNWALDGVTLQLTSTNPGNPLFNSAAAGQVLASWMQNDAWVEGNGTPALSSTEGITFDSLPSFLSGADESLGSFAFSGATSGTNTYSLSLSIGLNSDALAGSLTSVRLSAGESGVAALFNSRNFGTPAGRPVLILSASEVPEPASGLLCGFGMLLLVVRSFSSRLC
jgi:hypothetical protein